ncbi:hypothetical protein G7L40_19935 [Paenibacillus polymyxa]|uniref:Uncharacterized protein n=1 Tax=Paenibacillus polymyxa TaxID=1406 RepID=A0A378Y1A0_PAEPO|nr:hypothetical protein [Paenibacillus polymyxa]MBE7896240.1 hypothetical protein [Paenibacillus polymyxa]MCC3256768.1 hypothetical protein [Paenibacillus polymyxa]QPK54744.1 hypothetical protein G7035_19975 [Paenibacillus polymyxa]QPK59835.1 hypothetical protein G7L40_19935 [Paenibacillus polymyxa]UOD84569.1 hypothetical protein CUU60_04865 [Paenibacillus polymyxa ATCC 842]
MINITDKCINRDGYQMIYVNTDSQQGELSNNEWQRDINKHLSTYQSIKDKEEISYNDLLDLSIEGISFWIKVMNTDCYNTSNVLIELTLQYVNKEVTYYISRETYYKIINQSDEKTKVLENTKATITAFNSMGFPYEMQTTIRETKEENNKLIVIHKPKRSRTLYKHTYEKDSELRIYDGWIDTGINDMGEYVSYQSTTTSIKKEPILIF